MTTSSSEPRAATISVHRLAVDLGRRGIQATLPVREVEQQPPPPPPPPVDVRPLVQSVHRGWTELKETLAEMLAEIERELPTLILDAVESILRHEVDQGHYDLRAPLREILDQQRKLLDARSIVLRVNPTDAGPLQQALEADELPLPLELRADPEVARGSLHIDSGATQIVRTLADELTQLGRRFHGEEV